MSVNAIQQLQSAETQAALLLQQAETELQQQRAAISETIEHFQIELQQSEKKQQQQISQQAEVAFQQVSEPLALKTEEEIGRLRRISPEKKAQALKLILEKVVN